MRAVGLPYMRQKFEVEGVTIHVWIEPGQDYIKLDGGTMDYVVWPSTDEHLVGVVEVTDALGNTKSVDPRALVGISPKRIAKNKNVFSGEADWVSYDGLDKNGNVKYGKHLLTYGASTFRYDRILDSAWPDGRGRKISVNGNDMSVAYRPMGAGMLSWVEDNTGKVTRCVVYACSVDGGIGLRWFSNLTDAVADETPFALYTVSTTTPERVTHRVFFDGTGLKFVTVKESLSPLGDDYIAPRTQINGAISVTGSGVFSATFTESALDLLPETDTGTDDTSAGWYYDYDDPFASAGAAYSNQTHHHLVEYLVGVDMGIDGTPLRVTKRITTDRYNNASRGPGGFGSGGASFVGPSLYDFASTATYEIRVNNSILYSGPFGVSTLHESNASAGSTGVVTVHSELTTTYAISLRDIDARHRALAVARVEHSTSWNYTDSLVEDGGTYTRVRDNPNVTVNPEVTDLILQFGAFSASKVIATIPWSGIDPTERIVLLGDRIIYRMIASRRQGEMLASVALISTDKWHEDAYGSLLDDPAPLIVAMKKGKLYPLTAKMFGMAGESNLHLEPISLTATDKPPRP